MNCAEPNIWGRFHSYFITAEAISHAIFQRSFFKITDTASGKGQVGAVPKIRGDSEMIRVGMAYERRRFFSGRVDKNMFADSDSAV
jgi:hypothetical protein